MATTQKGFIGAGFRYVVVLTKNSSGAMIGSDSTEPTAGASTGTTGLRVEGAQTLPIGPPDSELVDVTGDDEPQVQFDFGESTLPNGLLELSTRNLFLEAMTQGTTVYQPDSGNVDLGVLQPENRDLQDVALLLGRRAKSWTPGSRGVERWEMLFIPSCTLTPKGTADWTQRAHGPYRFGVSVSKGDIMPWGETFSIGTVGTSSASLEPVEANKAYWIDIFKGNGVNATFNLSKTPNTTETALVGEAGVLVASANYTISTGPDIITFSGGNEPANLALVHVFYPIDESSL
jgi:hypothetical protein